MKVGVRRPPRVLVRFVGDEHEGRSEWVSPARLVSPWSESVVWVTRQLEWQRVVSASQPARYTVEANACEEVFSAFDPNSDAIEFSETGTRAGVLIVAGSSAADVSALSAATGTGGFWDGELFVAAWPAALNLARLLASEHSDVVADPLRQAEREYRSGALTGDDRPLKGFEGRSYRELFTTKREACNLALGWCNPTSVGRADDVAWLRDEVKRLEEQSRRLVRTLRDTMCRPMTDRILKSIALQVGVNPNSLGSAEAYRWEPAGWTRSSRAADVAAEGSASPP
ncbi:MAG: hypothetical protein JWM34_1911 [Ilumatobacteraceae bacterium]|nr:hypothetical protein [Ilumatobacteraceae bacterium]